MDEQLWRRDLAGHITSQRSTSITNRLNYSQGTTNNKTSTLRRTYLPGSNLTSESSKSGLTIDTKPNQQKMKLMQFINGATSNNRSQENFNSKKNLNLQKWEKHPSFDQKSSQPFSIGQIFSSIDESDNQASAQQESVSSLKRRIRELEQETQFNLKVLQKEIEFWKEKYEQVALENIKMNFQSKEPQITKEYINQLYQKDSETRKNDDLSQRVKSQGIQGGQNLQNEYSSLQIQVTDWRNKYDLLRQESRTQTIFFEKKVNELNLVIEGLRSQLSACYCRTQVNNSPIQICADLKSSYERIQNQGKIVMRRKQLNLYTDEYQSPTNQFTVNENTNRTIEDSSSSVCQCRHPQ